MKRVECLHKCGTMVLIGKGECRKCRRARVHAGLKRIKRKLPEKYSTKQRTR